MRRFTAAALCAALMLFLLLTGCKEEEVPTISFAGREVPAVL